MLLLNFSWILSLNCYILILNKLKQLQISLNPNYIIKYVDIYQSRLTKLETNSPKLK